MGKVIQRVLFELIADWKKKNEEAEGGMNTAWFYTTSTMTTRTADIIIT